MPDDEPMQDAFPPELLLDGYPEPMRAIAERLRVIVRRAAPDAIEAVRSGWRLIGYDLVVGRRRVFFAFVTPETEHVHLGFHHGVLMRDPERLLVGAGITKQARWLTFRPGEPIDEPTLERLIREAARVSGLSRSERFAIALDRETDSRA